MKIRHSFTLVELLVVISIIGILSGIGVVTFRDAQEKAKIGRAKTELETLKTAMNMYYQDVGELPPRGDNCSGCSNPCNSTWMSTISAMFASDGSGWNGPYLDQRIDKDPWGNYYCYDDNTPDCCGEQSFVCSMGPNGSRESFPSRTGQGAQGDDVCVIVIHDGVY